MMLKFESFKEAPIAIRTPLSNKFPSSLVEILGLIGWMRHPATRYDVPRLPDHVGNFRMAL
jgi:hypothetical protein